MKPSASWGRKGPGVTPDSLRSTADLILPSCLRRIPVRAPTSSHAVRARTMAQHRPLSHHLYSAKQKDFYQLIALDVCLTWRLFLFLPKLMSLPGELLKNRVPGFQLYLLLQLLKIPSLCYCLNHTHSSGHRTVELEEVGCSLLNYIPSMMHNVLSSKYFKLKSSCKHTASVNKAAQQVFNKITPSPSTELVQETFKMKNQKETEFSDIFPGEKCFLCHKNKPRKLSPKPTKWKVIHNSQAFT